MDLFDQIFKIHDVEIKKRPNRNSNPCGQWMVQRFFLLIMMVFMVLTAPINAIPIIGSLFWLCFNGFILAWGLHGRYFEQKGLNYCEQFDYVWAHKEEYIAFGLVAMLADFIPLFGFLMVYGAVVGSALWAVKLEQSNVFDDNVTEQQPILSDFSEESDNIPLLKQKSSKDSSEDEGESQLVGEAKARSKSIDADSEVSYDVTSK